MKLLALLMVLQTFHVIHGQDDINSCNNLEENTCAVCLQKPGCAWCSDEVYSSPRCNTVANHKQNLCPQNHTVNPQSDKKLTEQNLGQTNQITPSKAKLTVRVDEPITFTIKVKPASNYPVDLYYLMDLSATMADDLVEIKALAGDISETLKNLTNQQRLAFGTFVDKVTPPFVRYEKINKSFCADLAKCDVPYDFKHILDFTSSGVEFKNTVKNVLSSGNRDLAEGTFDALMQVATCADLNWRPAKTCRRIVLIATDGLFHMAADGKLGGIITPNDGQCHLSPKRADGYRYYSQSLELDYPSVNQIYQSLENNDIQPIFAVSKTAGEVVLNTYKALVTSWKDLNAQFEELKDGSTDILNLIRTSYNAIVETVQISHSELPDNVKIKVVPKCSEPIDNKCINVKPGNEVSFDISITATSCKTNNSKFTIGARGFGNVEIVLNVICRCACQDKKIYNSTVCRGNGTLVCGRCECNSGWSGRTCQCDPSKTQNFDKNDCKRTNTSIIICEGNGECDCGECQCSTIGNTGEKFYGDYCQCSNFNCPQYENKQCGGDKHGECKCGKCICKTGNIGSNCGDPDCSLQINKCLNKNRVNCSSHGTCECGVCNCEIFYEGTLCENCPSCAGRCNDYQQCVLCKVFGFVPENKTTCANCPPIERLESVDDFKTLSFPERCSSKDSDGCTYHYTYGSEKGKNITIYAVTNKECPEGPDVLLIVLAVIGGIVGIGIILLILWKLLTAMVDRREYQKFEQDRAKSKWHREKNPLYKPATSTVQNPTFVGSKKE